MCDFKPKISKTELAQLSVRAIFNGRIHLIDTEEKANNALKFLKNEKVVGFDSEWKPVFGKGDRYSKVALIQIATETDAYLFQTHKIGIPLELAKLLASPYIKKVGLSLNDDYQSIQLLVPEFPFAGFIDLQKFVPEFGIKDKSLRKIYAILFNEKISKSQQTSNWAADKLSLAQLKYAALDAYACLRIYRYLNDIRREKQMKPVLYFADWCPDTAPFKAKLEKLGVEYIPFDITKSGAALKAFLKLRDTLPIFDTVKEKGAIGIPALLLEENRIILDLVELDQIFG